MTRSFLHPDDMRCAEVYSVLVWQQGVKELIV